MSCCGGSGNKKSNVADPENSNNSNVDAQGKGASKSGEKLPDISFHGEELIKKIFDELSDEDAETKRKENEESLFTFFNEKYGEKKKFDKAEKFRANFQKYALEKSFFKEFEPQLESLTVKGEAEKFMEDEDEPKAITIKHKVKKITLAVGRNFTKKFKGKLCNTMTKTKERIAVLKKVEDTLTGLTGTYKKNQSESDALCNKLANDIEKAMAAGDNEAKEQALQYLLSGFASNWAHGRAVFDFENTEDDKFFKVTVNHYENVIIEATFNKIKQTDHNVVDLFNKVQHFFEEIDEEIKKKKGVFQGDDDNENYTLSNKYDDNQPKNGAAAFITIEFQNSVDYNPKKKEYGFKLDGKTFTNNGCTFVNEEHFIKNLKCALDKVTGAGCCG